MKESEKRARTTVAYGGLVQLAADAHKNPEIRVTRTQLFAIPRAERTTPELITALKSKTWQKDYVQRLVDAGLLIKSNVDSQDKYSASSPEDINELVADHDDHGLRLLKFLFPHEAGMPAELLGEEEPEEGEGADETPAEDSEHDRWSRSGKPTDEAHLHLTPRSVTSLLGLLERIAGQKEETSKLLGRVERALDVLQTGSQADKEFRSYVKNRLKELGDQLDRVEKLQMSASAVASRVDIGLSNIDKMLIKLLTILGLPEGTLTLTMYLHNGFQYYFGEFFKRQDNARALQDTLAELRAKVKDLNVIEDLAMKAMEASEKSGG